MFRRNLMATGRLIGNQTLTQMRQTIYRPQLVAFMSTEIRKAIEDAVSSAPVVLFMKGTPEFPQCGFSKATIGILGQQGVDPLKFAAYNVLEDPELREAIKEFTEWPTIPQLFVNSEFVGGCDVIKSMAKSGELTELLEEAKVLVPEDYNSEKDP
ncbi:similar to Saccharomyces cerevisiae YPL059W GRX5 Hydroperoxide and superoxide-radical responsive glutathione-dependent oxidoreductase [Maudiozyma saulgeensis]|uniref:Monothiol glutaredoxin-5, mitochondrial n=1 Tax=Maudiozyma saulgeensis TaxID=1789683 RepID=A0A1X7R7L6_9SACH|nr:similar to Saccharomyces cerevisiae YPL059W GRX5 Hydroperoxide and superoxide-radical responsive glutathione-dependent oxidoreductase [Kazachstania saulgeensis]